MGRQNTHARYRSAPCLFAFCAFAALGWVGLGIPSTLAADGSQPDAPIIGDERAVQEHLDLKALGEMSPDALLAHGRMLFDAKFTLLDGAGRPAATQAEIPVKRRAGRVPAFFRTSGPEANACNGCHNQPGSGGSGEFCGQCLYLRGGLGFRVRHARSAIFQRARHAPSAWLGLCGAFGPRDDGGPACDPPQGGG